MNALIAGAVLILLLNCGFEVRAQKRQNWVTDSIRTSAHCEYCKKDIETALRSYKGVKKSKVDLDRGVLSVTYASGKVNPDSLRFFLSRMGYDADSLPARNKVIQRRKDPCFKRID
jgi:copper chaperone CopZ